MATIQKVINEIECNSADWHNLLAYPAEEHKTLIQSITQHPMVDCISVPFLFSYYYRWYKKQEVSTSYARYVSCKLVLEKLHFLK